jgi:hypothetical protein
MTRILGPPICWGVQGLHGTEEAGYVLSKNAEKESM